VQEYPHPIDRYRLIQKLISLTREAYGLEQVPLASRAKVTQSVISNLEHLEKSIENPKRRVSREDLLKVLTWGLMFKEHEVSAVLYVYNGCPLTEDEIRRYRPLHDVEDYTVKDLRTTFFTLLRKMLNSHFQDDSTQQAKVRILSGDEANSLLADRILQQLESLPGQRLMVTEFPSHLSHPLEAYYSDDLLDDPFFLSDRIQEEARKTTLERVETFHRHLKLYGERHILCKPSLLNYLKKQPENDQVTGDKNSVRHLGRYRHLSLKRRQEHIQHCIELLEKNPHYDIRLAGATPELELEIKSSQEVMLRGARRYERDEERPCWGPRYVHWLDDTSVLLFLLDFEMQWDKLMEEKDPKTEKERVINFFKDLLRNSG